jgi:hypothetical protein
LSGFKATTIPSYPKDSKLKKGYELVLSKHYDVIDRLIKDFGYNAEVVLSMVDLRRIK